MRLWIFIFINGTLFFLISCTSQNEDAKPDCSVSDLQISGSVVTDADCFAPGSITVTASGGKGPYTFSLGQVVFQKSSEFQNLFSGVYTVTVKDKDGCTASKGVTVGTREGGVVLEVVSNVASGCGTSNGMVTVSASGGVGGYTYQIGSGPFGSSTQFEGLTQGNHLVKVRDSAGCVSGSEVYVKSGVSLANDIMPVIEANCAISSCHKDSETPLLTSQSAVRINVADIKTNVSAGNMPPSDNDVGAKLTESERKLISCWADDVASMQ